ncbi:lactosylceramide 4-alpha-galactosyltransferase-like [Nymphalis io]|uniref:lactosylceramide 4-alpha-galactosyltransferase-like n=1 Tax=Inachis io TaxID=171585 RepID=UPI00216955B8|nr:lactosylceramide 4-alpha-galactosyltransferase-like [Nymphalis io]
MTWLRNKTISTMNVRRLFKRTRQKVLLFILTTISGILFLCTGMATVFFWGPSVDISCYLLYNNYSLPMLRENESLPVRSIFFIEPSCVSNLTSRQSCAIESAAKSNPNWQINVIFSGMSFQTAHNLTQFKKSKNIKFWKINIEEFTKETLFEELVTSGILKRCLWGVERTQDVLKYLMLRKWGGIHIDLDMIVARSFGSLARNWATRENEEEMADGIIGLSQDRIGTLVAESAIRNIKSNYKSRNWCKTRRLQVINGILQGLCSTTDTKFMSSITCNGFEVYGSQFFYPILQKSSRDFFTPGEIRNHNAYTYYLGGHDTKGYKAKKTSPFTRLAKKYCPKTYVLYKNQFGS